MQERANTLIHEVQASWLYFVPIWLHAILLPLYVVWLGPIMRQRENLAALLWGVAWCVWIFAAIAIKKRLIRIDHALMLGFLLYVPWAIVSLIDVIQLN